MNKTFEAYLYDAWEGMREEYLVDSEKRTIGDYSYLNMESTKNNLRIHLDLMLFPLTKGMFLMYFRVRNSKLVWLHIDLNSALPTVGALNNFGPFVFLCDFI